MRCTYKHTIGHVRGRIHRARTLSLLLFVWALVCGAACGPPAEAHALLRSSVPERGAVLRRAPDAVTLTFTEPPEPAFSAIHVLDRGGRPVETGAAETVPGQLLSLRVPLDGLPDGIYTVAWRTVSLLDGHVTGGTFEFGIGAVAAGSLASDTSPRPSALYVVSRLVLYAGVIGLLGTALAQGPAASPQAGLPWSLWGFWALAAGGVALLGLGQAVDTGAGLRLLGTPLGLALWRRALPVAAAAPAIAIARRIPRWSMRVGLPGLMALAMLAHVDAGHAAAWSGLRQWLAVLEQWVHFGSIGVWAGALLALLAAARTAPGDATAAGRWSLAAAGALGIAAVTGALRALAEVGSWSGFSATEFGRLVLVKAGLFLVLGLLGAGARRLVLSRNAGGPRRLGGMVAAEAAVAAGILAVTALMTGLAPPRAISGALSAPQTVQVPGAPIYTVALSGGRMLTVALDPGRPGLNALHATFTDTGGGELDIARAAEITLGRAGEAPRPVAVLQEGPGHFYSDVDLDRGDWEFSIAVITRAGETLRAIVSIHM